MALLIFALTIEPLRCLSMWLMRRARLSQDPCAQPRVLDFLSPSHSVVTHARQYFASLLCGMSSRLLLVWRLAQAESLKAWCAACPDQVRLLRRTVLVADSALHRRFVCVCVCVAGIPLAIGSLG